MFKKTHFMLGVIILSLVLMTGCDNGEPAPTAVTQTSPDSIATSMPLHEPSVQIPEMEPTSRPLPDQQIVNEVLISRENLPIDAFFEESFKQLGLREPDQMFMEDLGDAFGLPNDQFTNISDAYIRETQRLQSGILDLLHTYDLSELSTSEKRSFEAYEWFLEGAVQGKACGSV